FPLSCSLSAPYPPRIFAVLPLQTRSSRLPRSGTDEAIVPPSIAGILAAHGVASEDRAAVELVFAKLCRLHAKELDHVWGYYVRNLARPLSFTRPDHQIDVLVGNPPWLAYRHMPPLLQQRYQALAKPRGLWAGGKVATHQDLSDLFVARVIEQYLKPGGTFAFVLPFAVLSRRQYAGFRTGDWTSQGGGVHAARFDAPEEFARIKPPLFPVPACVISGSKTTVPRALDSHGLTWTGKVPHHHLGWNEASAYLTASANAIAHAIDSVESPYRKRFTQGATVVPRMLVTVDAMPAPPMGLPSGRTAIRNARSTNEKEPWKSMPSLEGIVEDRFLRPMHLGATIVAFRPRVPILAVVPWLDGELLDGSNDRLDEFPGLAAWWRHAERLWRTHHGGDNALTLRGRMDFQNNMTKQFPIAPHRVVYTASGQHLAACRIEDPDAVIEHKLYWAATQTVEEARYLTGILNSQALAQAVLPLQSRGQYGPRDFDMHIFALGFPSFDRDAALHLAVATLAARAERVSAAVALDDRWQFQKARRVTREALRDDGIARDIDNAVTELIRSTAPPEVAAALI
ncbi:MAG: N-6 DNA methylase, partial [Solirubrobacteraceae bacterium]